MNIKRLYNAVKLMNDKLSDKEIQSFIDRCVQEGIARETNICALKEERKVIYASSYLDPYRDGNNIITTIVYNDGTVYVTSPEGYSKWIQLELPEIGEEKRK